ncbi:MAG: hypothetical protein ACXVXN_00545 [Mycobacteriaceae bacterium]
MSPPTGVTLTAVPGVTASPDVEALKTAARTILRNVGVDYGPNKINRLVVTFANRVERNGFAFFDFLANSVQLDSAARRRALANPDVQRVISYADPTGETAVGHVLKERGF